MNSQYVPPEAETFSHIRYTPVPKHAPYFDSERFVGRERIIRLRKIMADAGLFPGGIKPTLVASSVVFGRRIHARRTKLLVALRQLHDCPDFREILTDEFVNQWDPAEDVSMFLFYYAICEVVERPIEFSVDEDGSIWCYSDREKLKEIEDKYNTAYSAAIKGNADKYRRVYWQARTERAAEFQRAKLLGRAAAERPTRTDVNSGTVKKNRYSS